MGSGGSKEKKENKKKYADERDARDKLHFSVSNNQPKEGYGVSSGGKIEEQKQFKAQKYVKGSESCEYADPNDPSVMGIEGLVKFLTDIGIDGDGVESLYLLYLMDTEQLNVIKISEYTNLLHKAHANSAIEAREYIKVELKKVNESEDHFK